MKKGLLILLILTVLPYGVDAQVITNDTEVALSFIDGDTVGTNPISHYNTDYVRFLTTGVVDTTSVIVPYGQEYDSSGVLLFNLGDSCIAYMQAVSVAGDTSNTVASNMVLYLLGTTVVNPPTGLGLQ